MLYAMISFVCMSTIGERVTPCCYTKHIDICCSIFITSRCCKVSFIIEFTISFIHNLIQQLIFYGAIHIAFVKMILRFWLMAF